MLHRRLGSINMFQKMMQKCFATTEVAATAAEHHPPARVPLIKFIGKRDPHKPIAHTSTRKSPEPPAIVSQPIVVTPVPSTVPSVTATAAAAQTAPVASKKPAFTPKPIKPHHPDAVEYTSLKARFMHGRKKLTAEEILAIELGGAE